jgi:hypothetical protein
MVYEFPPAGGATKLVIGAGTFGTVGTPKIGFGLGILGLTPIISVEKLPKFMGIFFL